MAKRDLVNGIWATALGILAVALAGLEFYVSVDITAPGSGDGATVLSRLTFGTGAYIVAYLVAGAVLMAIGIGRIRRSMRAG